MIDVVHQTPRGSLSIGLDSDRWSMRSDALAADWLAEMQRVTRVVGALGHPWVGPVAHCSIQDGRLVAGGPVPPTKSLAEAPPADERAWAGLTADLAQVASIADQEGVRCGPIGAGQVRVCEDTVVWLGLGTTAVAYDLDRGMRGATLQALPFETSWEAILGEPLDTRTDAWHIAVFLFRGLTGVSPYPGQSAFEHLDNVKAGRIRDPRRAGVSDALSELLVQALGHRAGRPTAVELIKALRGLSR